VRTNAGIPVHRTSQPSAAPHPTYLRRVPPLCSWNAFYHDIDENKVKQQAELMVSLGLMDAG
jgi:hypothetical protein